jgi:hypothetical protein
MDYSNNLKNLLMKGKMFRSKGQGIAGTGVIPQMQLSPAFREGGTISHRAVTGSIIANLERINQAKKSSKKSSSKKNKNTDFKPLKFNL